MNDNYNDMGEDVVDDYNDTTLKITMYEETPNEEGMYFIKYDKDSQPIPCQIYLEEDGELWLRTKSTSNPLNDVKAFCYGKI